jgi:hypothetical protein
MRADAKLTREEALRAADLKSQGWSLAQIQAKYHPDASLMCLSRAIKEVGESFARVEESRRTGDVSGLGCTEAVIALTAWRPKPKLEEK